MGQSTPDILAEYEHVESAHEPLLMSIFEPALLLLREYFHPAAREIKRRVEEDKAARYMADYLR